MRLKLTYVTGRIVEVECDEYEVLKTTFGIRKGFYESSWALANILKIEEV